MTAPVIRFGPAVGLGSLAEPATTVVVADALTSGLMPPGFDPGRVVIVERGESAKSLSSLEAVYARFLELGVERDWTVVGLGGGSVSDLAGLAASTWMRGVDFGFVPTTLLAMVDASVGGKNGVDFRGYKNLIGCFSQPRFVLVDTSLLDGLPDDELARGFVEAIKHGVIAGGEHYAAVGRAVDRRGRIRRGELGEVVRLSVELKSAFVEADALELGERRKLNLGHSFGHGVESVTGLPHGAAVAAGLATALRLAVELGGSSDDADEVIGLLERLGLPTGLEAARRSSVESRDLSPSSFREAVAEALGADKKLSGGLMRFALPLAIGNVEMRAIPLEELRAFARRAP